ESKADHSGRGHRLTGRGVGGPCSGCARSPDARSNDLRDRASPRDGCARGPDPGADERAHRRSRPPRRTDGAQRVLRVAGQATDAWLDPQRRRTARTMKRTAPTTSTKAEGGTPLLRERLGICQWFHYEDVRTLETAARLLRDLGVKHLRTGVSWADYLRPGGPRWYDQMFRALAEFDVLLSVWHTPPSISEGGSCASPPSRLRDFADFIDVLISRYGSGFTHLELWNEPNNRLKWDFPTFDPEWRKFGEMVGTAAYWAQQRRVPTVLGGMIPVDPHWLGLMKRWGALPYIDVVAIHGFPGMWWDDAPNWDWYRDWHGWS